MGEFCPGINIMGLRDNLKYINAYPNEDLAKEKSSEILKLLIIIARKLKGKRRKRQRNPYDGEIEEVNILTNVIKPTAWLYNKDMQVCAPKRMSRFELHPALYGDLHAAKEIYEILGFIEKEADETDETFQKASGLTRKDKKLLINQLARELGLQVTEIKETDGWGEEDGNEENFFDPNTWQDNEFPVNRVNNIDYLRKHVQEQFYCADPTTYRKVLRQIRTSKNVKADRAYAIGMYTNSSNIHICQMCRKPIAFIEVDQIANFGIELPQLNLCLCRDCSAKYRAIRDRNKDEFKNQIRIAFRQMDISETVDDYSIRFNEDSTLHFTQTHVAEIQEILILLSEYGTPVIDEEDLPEAEVTGPLLHPIHDEIIEDIQDSIGGIGINNEMESTDEDMEDEPQILLDPDVARKGSFVSYKKKNTSEIKEIMQLEPSKYPLHKQIEGHKASDVVRLQAFYYEILAVMND